MAEAMAEEVAADGPMINVLEPEAPQGDAPVAVHEQPPGLQIHPSHWPAAAPPPPTTTSLATCQRRSPCYNTVP